MKTICNKYLFVVKVSSIKWLCVALQGISTQEQNIKTNAFVETLAMTDTEDQMSVTLAVRVTTQNTAGDGMTCPFITLDMVSCHIISFV